MRDSSTPAADAAFDAGEPDAGSQDSGPPDAGEQDSGPPECEPVAVASYCSSLPALPDPPLIDGALDCGPALATMTPSAWNGPGSKPASHETKIAIASRPDGIYFYVEVRGDPLLPHPSGDIYCGEAVELYVDADGVYSSDGRYNTPGSVQLVVAAPSASSPGTLEALRFTDGNNQGAWTGGRVKTATFTGGYAVEGFVTADDLGLAAWTPTSKVGVNVSLDVSAPPGTPDLRCGTHLGQYFMRVNSAGTGTGSCTGEPWCDTRAFCTPTLQ